MANLSYSGVPGIPGTGEPQVKKAAFSLGGITNTLNNFFDKTVNDITDSLSGGLIGDYKKLSDNATKASGATYDLISEIFLRSVIIILGFIFMAVGLSMFKAPINISLKNAVKSVVK